MYLSFAPPSTFKSVPTYFDNEDKLVHLLMYFGLTAVLIFDLKSFSKKTNIKKLTFVWFCLVFPIIFGGLVEILQPMYFAPRTADWLDWSADTIGVFVGCLAMVLLKMTPKTID